MFHNTADFKENMSETYEIYICIYIYMHMYLYAHIYIYISARANVYIIRRNTHIYIDFSGISLYELSSARRVPY